MADLSTYRLATLPLIGKDGLSHDERPTRYYRLPDGSILSECWGYRTHHPDPWALAATIREHAAREVPAHGSDDRQRAVILSRIADAIEAGTVLD